MSWQLIPQVSLILCFFSLKQPGLPLLVPVPGHRSYRETSLALLAFGTSFQMFWIWIFTRAIQKITVSQPQRKKSVHYLAQCSSLSRVKGACINYFWIVTMKTGSISNVWFIRERPPSDVRVLKEKQNDSQSVCQSVCLNTPCLNSIMDSNCEHL